MRTYRNSKKQGKRLLFHSLFVFENYPVPEGTAGEEGSAD